MNKNTILITGGLGYIGSHVAVELIKAGLRVAIVDDLSNSRIEVLDGIEEITGVRPDFEEINVCNKFKLHEFVAEYDNIGAVIHFAAYKAVGESVENPLKYYHNNINSLLSLIAVMQDEGIENLVFSSSATVYGQADEMPVTEKTPLKKATNPYGATKQICEDIISDIAKSNEEFNSVLLRYFNPIGAHESALIGELPLGVPANLVPFITQTAIGKREELLVFGDDYNTSDGTGVRDYIHVVDLARAHVVAVKRLIEEKNKENVEIFNLGTGKGNSVLEVIKSFEKVSGEKLNYKIVDRRAGDIDEVYTSTDLANKELGWQAEKTLDDALLSAWEWEKRIDS